MAENMMDYQKLLADMEANKNLLEQAIASLRAVLAAGALGTPGDLSAGLAIAPIGATGPGGDIPQGAFLGKSIPDAVILYLQAVRKRCPTNEIVQGLKKGGIVSTSKTFDIVVGNTLRRLKREGKLLLFDDGWGLPEWVPEGLRSRVDQQAKAQAKVKKRKPSKTKVASKKAKEPPTIRPKSLIENYFSTHLGVELSAKEVAEKLNINGHGLVLILAQMVRKGGLEKTANGKFRRSNKITPISKAG